MKIIKNDSEAGRLGRPFLCLLLVLCLTLPFLGGCSGVSGGSSEETTADPFADVEVNQGFVDEIRDRGYLIAGCKMDVPDLGYYDKEMDTWSGLEVEIARKTAADIFDVNLEEVGEKNLVHIVGVTVADREDKLDSGEIDCMIATYTITEERAKRFAFSESYYTEYIGLMVRYTGESDNINSLGTSEIRSLADIDGKVVAVARNSTTRKDMLDYIDSMNTLKVSPRFSEYGSYDAMFKALKNKDVDVMSVDVSILKGYVDGSTRILGDRFAGQHYGAAVKPENRLLLEHINRALK